MATSDSALDPKAMAHARRLLSPREPARERMWPAVTAAGVFAVAALSFAVAMVLAPPLVTQHVPQDRGRAIQ